MCKDSGFKEGERVLIINGLLQHGTVLGCHTMLDGRVRVLVDKDDGGIWSGPVELIRKDYQPLPKKEV